MAGAIHSTKHHKLTTVEQSQNDPSKFYHHFLYKAAIVVIFFVVLPLFPSQAPEFINQSLLTRNWELLHLIFVGIAVSYGLFSRRNDETEKEDNSKFDSAQSLVSRFLQVSSFFEDEVENPSESDETKVQTWSNQHYRNKPVVVVAPQAQHSDDEDQSAGLKTGEKHLLLPVRSLKSRLDDVVPSVENSGTNSLSLNRSNSKTGSKRFSSNLNKARNEELEGPRMEDNTKENVVLPSPIPWRSRSARMEPKQEVETPTQHASKEESEFNKVESRPLKSQTSRSSRTSSMSPSPKFTPSPSPSPLFSSELLAKNREDLLKKKGFDEACPPPPPPPPPMMFQKSFSMKPRYGSFNEEASFDKELKRSFTSERNGMKVKPRGYVENMLTGKSVRGREIGKEGMNSTLDSNQEEEEEEDEEHSMQEPTRKNMGYERISFRTDKFMGHASVPLVSEPASMKKESFLDKLIVESDDEETETEDEDVGGGRIIQKESGESPPVREECSKTDGPSSSGTMGDEGPDVDKKADEFIAKFREQIRLQRIESIKRSTRSTRNSLR